MNSQHFFLLWFLSQYFVVHVSERESLFDPSLFHMLGLANFWNGSSGHSWSNWPCDGSISSCPCSSLSCDITHKELWMKGNVFNTVRFLIREQVSNYLSSIPSLNYPPLRRSVWLDSFFEIRVQDLNEEFSYLGGTGC